jgi:2-polyprenyl-3-methyl-5-hydroxy-6-metoxy-1,4-benzoquinol methylase
MFDKKQHWENIYSTKQLEQLSWYEQKPSISLAFLKNLRIAKNAKIIDIGGGETLFADSLLELGYQDITILDISEKSIEKAKLRLKEKSNQINWIIADATQFVPNQAYDFWHDRAAFHFLTDEQDTQKYIQTIKNGLSVNGRLVVGTFSDNGPEKCSGIAIKQYSEQNLTIRFNEYFQKIKCIKTEHITPSKTIQNFVFCSFKLSKMSFNN